MGALEDYVRSQRIKDRNDPMRDSVMSRQSVDPLAYSPEQDALERVEPESYLSMLGLLKGLTRSASSKVSRALPEGMSVKEFGSTPADREAIDQILGPWLARGSKVSPDDRDIFMSMRNIYDRNPNTRTRVLIDETRGPLGAYQITNRGGSSYIPNVGVSAVGQGYGKALMNHAISNKENPTFLVSAPGKEGFYRKVGMREMIDPDTEVSSFHFKQGGLVQYKECNCGK